MPPQKATTRATDVTAVTRRAKPRPRCTSPWRAAYAQARHLAKAATTSRLRLSSLDVGCISGKRRHSHCVFSGPSRSYSPADAAFWRASLQAMTTASHDKTRRKQRKRLVLQCVYVQTETNFLSIVASMSSLLALLPPRLKKTICTTLSPRSVLRA